MVVPVVEVLKLEALMVEVLAVVALMVVALIVEVLIVEALMVGVLMGSSPEEGVAVVCAELVLQSVYSFHQEQRSYTAVAHRMDTPRGPQLQN